MHGRLALIALSLVLPSAASGAVKPRRDIREVEVLTSSAGHSARRAPRSFAPSAANALRAPREVMSPPFPSVCLSYGR